MRSSDELPYDVLVSWNEFQVTLLAVVRVVVVGEFDCATDPGLGR
jgi:hypothetical protein